VPVAFGSNLTHVSRELRNPFRETPAVRTPRSPRDSVAPTLNLHRLRNEPGAPDRDDPHATPLPARPGAGAPRVRGYEIICVVGCGGMGIVYEARHTELNRRVALKTLRGEALADPEYRDRFRAEAEAIARLQHPNVIQVFEVGTIDAPDDGTDPGPFLALEFVDGGNLAQYTGAPQPPRLAAQMVATLARAAHAAHRLGVIHRDLKPANVLLTRTGEPKIADFGIAKRIDAEHLRADGPVTRAGTFLGTPEYMAPEYLQGGAAAPAVDVYALGVILYQLLTGRVPFQGATCADTMLLALQQEPLPPHRLQPGLPGDLETICLKCLEKGPAARYESAAALADDLTRWADGHTIRARPVGTAGRTVRWARRNPTVATLSVAVLLVAVTGVAGIVWQWTGARASAARAEAAAHKAREAADKERRERYRVSVFAAASALRLHDTNAVRRGLDAAPEEHRDWVWHVLRAQLDRSRRVLGTDAEARTTRAAFTPDGRWAVLDDAGGAVRVWDVATATEFHPLGAEAGARLPALSPDGAALAYATDDARIVVCDPATGRARLTLTGHTAPIDTLAFSADGTRLVSTGYDRTARIWDPRTGVPVRTFQAPAGSTLPLVLSPDLRLVAVRSPNGASAGTAAPRVWDLETGRAAVPLDGPLGRISALRFGPTGDRLVASECYPNNTLRLWDARTGRLIATMNGHENAISHLTFSPDGSRIVSSSLDRTARIWDGAPAPAGRDGGAVRVLRGHTEKVQQATLSPDGKRLVTSADDRTLRFWDVETGTLLAVLPGHTDRVLAAAFGAGGTTVHSAAADGTVRVWDVNEIECDFALRGHTKFVYGVAFHPDGERVASAAWDGTARVWDVTRRRQLLTLTHGRTPPDPNSQMVSALAYHPTGRYLATLARDDSVRLWDGASGALLHRWDTPTDDFRDTRLAFSPDGTLLAAGDFQGNVHLWAVDRRTELAVLGKHADGVRDVAFSPDGRWLASASEDRTVRVWDVAARRTVRVLGGHTACVYALAWKPGGGLLATGSTDGTVRLWDTATWEEVGPALRQGVRAYAVAFTPDGRLLAVACVDNLIRIWDVATHQELAELSGHGDYVHALAFSPDGTRLVSGAGDGTVRVWDAVPAAVRNGRRRAPD
jgi:WD40 repeat protein/tRNA A-37 threonylcarbamoyl transferase component Bud32